MALDVIRHFLGRINTQTHFLIFWYNFSISHDEQRICHFCLLGNLIRSRSILIRKELHCSVDVYIPAQNSSRRELPHSRVEFFWFLGGLSLHLNHLIAERVSAPYRQFGTLPIGIFLSNLDSG